MAKNFDSGDALRHYGAPLLARSGFDWGSGRATLMQRQRTGGLTQRFQLPWTAFRLGVSGTFARGSTQRLDGGAPKRLVNGPGLASFFPAGTNISNEVIGATRLSYLVVEIDEESLAEDGKDVTDSSLPIDDLTDPLCLSLLAALKNEIEAPWAPQVLFAETVSLALLLAVSRVNSSKTLQCATPLSPRRLALVTEYMLENISTQVSLVELAALVGLSRSHFCRTFKASTGTTPHRWIINARITRAKEMIAHDRRSLADVAATLGFADQSHFSTAFRRSVGATPRAWQRDRW